MIAANINLPSIHLVHVGIRISNIFIWILSVSTNAYEMECLMLAILSCWINLIFINVNKHKYDRFNIIAIAWKCTDNDSIFVERICKKKTSLIYLKFLSFRRFQIWNLVCWPVSFAFFLASKVTLCTFFALDFVCHSEIWDGNNYAVNIALDTSTLILWR